ncbi:MAG TPA: hypothetical protein VJ652_14965 [Noviherbaspirillum sp.]|nr:hypothetical protein [Noviherbaspirillum sp.]
MNIEQLKSAIIAAGVKRNIIEAGAPVSDETLLNIVACLGMGPKNSQPAQEPVYYSITVNGQHCGNFWPIQEEAEAAAKRLNASYPQDSRAVVPLFNHPQPSAPVAQAERIARETVENFKRALYKVPYFADRVNKATREALSEAHSIVLSLPAYLDAASTAPQVEAKEGWKLVPVKPTLAMLEAGSMNIMANTIAGYCYRAMLDAAPSSQKEGEQPK